MQLPWLYKCSPIPYLIARYNAACTTSLSERFSLFPIYKNTSPTAEQEEINLGYDPTVNLASILNTLRYSSNSIVRSCRVSWSCLFIDCFLNNDIGSTKQFCNYSYNRCLPCPYQLKILYFSA